MEKTKKPFTLKNFVYIVIGVLLLFVFFNMSKNQISASCTYDGDVYVRVIASRIFSKSSSISAYYGLDLDEGAYILDLNEEDLIISNVVSVLKYQAKMGLQLTAFILVLLSSLAVFSFFFIKSKKVKTIMSYSIAGVLLVSAIFLFCCYGSFVKELVEALPILKIDGFAVSPDKFNPSYGFVGVGIYLIFIATGLAFAQFIPDRLELKYCFDKAVEAVKKAFFFVKPFVVKAYEAVAKFIRKIFKKEDYIEYKEVKEEVVEEQVQ